MQRILALTLLINLTTAASSAEIGNTYYTYLNMCGMYIYHFDIENSEYHVYTKIEGIDKNGKTKFYFDHAQGQMDKVGEHRYYLTNNYNLPTDINFSNPDKVYMKNVTGETFLTPCDHKQSENMISEIKQSLREELKPEQSFATN